MQRLDNNADTIQLVILDNRDFKNARITGEQLYRCDRFPEGVYPNLQARPERADIRTLAVGSSVTVVDQCATDDTAADRLL